ncbi:MAG: FadR/GntR family transcriptional regulator [Variovorax sp.]
MSVNPLKNLKVVRSKRIYEQIAEQIEALIRAEKLPVGSRLPSERDLAEFLGVSRPSLREAMIALETLGLVEVRVGEGTVVARPPEARSAAAVLARSDLGPGPLEQFEARRAIEVACAQLAAQRASEANIEQMQNQISGIQALIRRGVNPKNLHRQFHESLARASGNLLFVKIVCELWDYRAQPMWELLCKKVDNPESWNTGVAMRIELVEYLRQRNSEMAGRVMSKHFDRVGKMYFG